MKFSIAIALIGLATYVTAQIPTSGRPPLNEERTGEGKGKKCDHSSPVPRVRRHDIGQYGGQNLPNVPGLSQDQSSNGAPASGQNPLNGPPKAQGQGSSQGLTQQKIPGQSGSSQVSGLPSKADVPKVDAPKVDAPKVDSPKPEAPKADGPKPDVQNKDGPSDSNHQQAENAPKTRSRRDNDQIQNNPLNEIPPIDQPDQIPNNPLGSSSSDESSSEDSDEDNHENHNENHNEQFDRKKRQDNIGQVPNDHQEHGLPQEFPGRVSSESDESNEPSDPINPVVHSRARRHQPNNAGQQQQAPQVPDDQSDDDTNNPLPPRHHKKPVHEQADNSDNLPNDSSHNENVDDESSFHLPNDKESKSDSNSKSQSESTESDDGNNADE